MPLIDAQIIALKAEINNDPRGYGYAADVAVGNADAVAKRLNLKRDGSSGTVPLTPLAVGGRADGKILLNRISVGKEEVHEAIDSRDWVGAGAATIASIFQGAHLESILQRDRIILTNPDGTATRTRANLDRAVGNGQGSQTRLDVLKTAACSRAQEMFGSNTDAPLVVTDAEVSKALQLP